VCFSHANEETVFEEIRTLQDAGLSVYYDEGIAPGHEWTQELADALDGASHLLFFVTAQSVESRQCRNEIQYALDQDKPVVSVYLEPTQLPGGLKLALGAAQAILKYEITAEEYGRKISRALNIQQSMGGAPSTETVAAEPDTTNQEQRRFPGWSVAAALAVVAIGVSFWLLQEEPATQPALDLSISVGEFEETGGADTSYSGALSERIRLTLTGYQELRTLSPGAGTEVESAKPASYRIDGSVRHQADGLRINASLTRTDDGASVWAQSFDIPPAEDDLADTGVTIARFVRGQLVLDQQCETVRRTSSSAEAAKAYCAALEERFRYSQGGDIDVNLEMQNARHAIALDPNIADAYRALAQNLIVQVFTGTGTMHWREAAAEARVAIGKGLEISPGDPRLLYVLGQLQHSLDLNLEGARVSFEAALERDPLHPGALESHLGLGDVERALGNHEAALRHYQRALRLNDARAEIYAAIGLSLNETGRHQEAVRVIDEGLRLVESGYGRAVLIGTQVLAFKALDETDKAHAALENGLATVGTRWQFLLASPLAHLGREQEAREIAESLLKLDPPPLDVVIFTLAALGDEQVFDLIPEAIDRRLQVTTVMRMSGFNHNLVDHPRWDEVMAHLEAEEAKGAAGEI
jgi:tetratricopeptide (TPR) repeat protein